MNSKTRSSPQPCMRNFISLLIICCAASAHPMVYNWEQPYQKQLTLAGRHDAQILATQLSQDGAYTLTTDEAGVANIWDTDSGTHLQTFKNTDLSAITSTTISPDNNLIALAHWNRTITTWNRKTGVLLTTIKLEGVIASLRFGLITINGTSVACLVACNHNRTITYYDPYSGALLDIFDEGKIQDTYSFDINSEMTYVLLGSRQTDIYDLASKNKIYTFTSPDKDQLPLSCFTRKKNRIVSNTKHLINTWDITTKKLLTDLNASALCSSELCDVQSNHDGTHLILYFSGNKIVIWDIENNQPITHVIKKPNNTSFYELSPDKRCYITITPGEQQIIVKDIVTNALVKTISCCSYSTSFKGFYLEPSGKLLVTIPDDRSSATLLFFQKNLFKSHKQSMLGYRTNRESDIHKFADVFLRFE